MENKKRVSNSNNTSRLFKDIISLIEQSRQQIALTINSEITLLYWKIGKVINKQILKHKRADYGEQIVTKLAQQLTSALGRGWSKQQLWNCLRSAETIQDKKIYALSRQLSWTHIRILIFINDSVKRDFYMQLCQREKWSTRLLQERIDSMLYERTALSKKPTKLIKKELALLQTENKLTPDLVFRDPYVLDFLGLQDTYSEQDMESAILKQLQQFIIELGTDFAFLARQKRIQIDEDDYRIDLLFYHRGLRRLVAIDLKLGKFKAAYKGQMELYLKWLDQHEKKEGEDNPIGLILCSEKQSEQIRLLELDKGHIRVAEYMTQLPSKKLLTQKLQKAIAITKKK
ncbi:YhcG family protein [Chitinophaga sp. GbtcB8]|uniref:PDDEXK nuclease domain-containing protein n=1 Tax=Chitinophaga sp. GbtcB8 TaxID=2824753 RepID=UPI001C303900|nr:PDDEXK nuclease domain-containing protein [Chitinophaga sp. GbtcB8]